MKDAALSRLAARVGTQLRGAGLRVVTAESCTAGWIAKALTDVPGSSEWFDSGYVVYSNEAKVRAVDVSPRTLDHFGAVSGETVREMARGALRVSGVEVAVAVSGIAGPDGGTPDKPVGTVWFCVARRRGERRRERIERVTVHERFRGDRDTVRRKSVERALRLIGRLLAPRAPAARSVARARRKELNRARRKARRKARSNMRSARGAGRRSGAAG
jgi:nicotinamide-nucleotide amidase